MTDSPAIPISTNVPMPASSSTSGIAAAARRRADAANASPASAAEQDRQLDEAREELGTAEPGSRRAPLARPSSSADVARVVQREQRVAGDGAVERRPRERARSPPAPRSATRSPQVAPQAHPQEVEAGEDPRLGPQQPAPAPAARTRASRGAAAPPRAPPPRRRAPCTGRRCSRARRGTAKSKRVSSSSAAIAPTSGVKATLAEPVDPPRRATGTTASVIADPDAVAALAQQRQQRARGDRERMLGRHAETLEERGLQVEHLAAPQQRVVGVVVRVRREDEKADDGSRRTARAKRDLGELSTSTRRARAAIPEPGPRPGECRTLHRAPDGNVLSRHEADHPDPVPQRGGRASRSRSPTSRARSRGSRRSSG